jgi:DnaJ homolog subfamily C member 8
VCTKGRACRKLSLLVHPDKCAHERAADAFEVIGAAQAHLLDAERREGLMRVLEYAREAVREVRRKATKHDSAVRVAAALDADGRAGVERGWELTDDFHDKWRDKSRDVLARSEFRRRKLSKRCAARLLHACWRWLFIAERPWAWPCCRDMHS